MAKDKIPCLRRPPIIDIDLVNGEETKTYKHFCMFERIPNAKSYEDCCGIEGTFYIEKEIQF